MHCKEIIVFFLTGMIRIVFFFLNTNTGSCCSTVVTVSNIRCRDLFFEDPCNFSDSLIVFNYPEMVTKTFVSGKIINRFSIPDNIIYNIINFIICGIRKENRLDISIITTHINHSVFFFFRACQFMFFNNTIKIIFGAGSSHEAILSASVHGLGIDVILFFFILHQPFVLFEHFIIVYRFLIYGLSMLINTFFQVNLSLCYMKQRIRITFCFNAGFS